MCVDVAASTSRWTDVDDVILATRHRLPLLITAPTDQAVVSAAREIHAATFTFPAPLVTFRASGFFEQAEPFAAQWRALCDAARDGSVLITALEDLSCAAQLRLLESLEERRGPGSPRLIAGTTVPLVDRVATGEFSEELFYRVNTLHLVVQDEKRVR